MNNRQRQRPIKPTKQLSEIDRLGRVKDELVNTIKAKCDHCKDMLRDKTLGKNDRIIRGKELLQSLKNFAVSLDKELKSMGVSQDDDNVLLIQYETPLIYNCTICKKQFHNSDTLYRHMSEKHSQKFKCSRCIREFGSLLQLWLHLKAYHQQLYFNTISGDHCCIYCQQRFPSDNAIMSHLEHTHQEQLKPDLKEFTMSYMMLFPSASIPSSF